MSVNMPVSKSSKNLPYQHANQKACAKNQLPDLHLKKDILSSGRFFLMNNVLVVFSG